MGQPSISSYIIHLQFNTKKIINIIKILLQYYYYYFIFVTLTRDAASEKFTTALRKDSDELQLQV